MPVEDRAADTWEPLVAVADLAGADWPLRARRAAAVLTADRENNTDMPLRVRLLVDCRTAFGPQLKALSTVLLLGYLKADPEAPWADHGPHGLTARRLATMLREYDINSCNVRLADGTQAKGYVRDDFADAWDRYCPRPGPEALAGLDDAAAGSDEGRQDTAGGGGGHGSVPIRPSRPSPGQPRDGLKPWDGKSVPGPAADALWDGLAVPPAESVPALTRHGTAGTDWDGTRPRAGQAPATAAICIGCRKPLAYDDGTQTHPGCTLTEQEATHV